MLSPSSSSRLPAHVALLMLAVIVFTSFYPFSDWSYSGRPLFEFLFYPLPYYFRLFDNLVNCLIYIPYGFALALVPRRHWLGWLWALAAAGATSFCVEFGQQFLPTRVASNLDIAYNLAGALAGATLAVSPFTVRAWRHVRDWRAEWFAAGAPADYAVALVVLWFVTQLNPSVPIFGVVVRPIGLPQPFVSPLDNPVLFLFLLEAGGAMLHLIALLLFVTCFLRHRRYTARAVGGVILLALLLKLLAAGALLKPFAFFEWFDLNVMAGLSSGFLLVWAITRLGRITQTLCALLALVASQMVVAIWPLRANTQDMLGLFRWGYGHLENMGALVEFLSHLWPWAAGVCLLASLLRELRRPRSGRP
ncbi:VanZ family protein [Crenobacter luteus]|uniref:Teicoplanin resistance protein VanZ n=1 Tax=Crenobacter luteus TaxID=1452487 RepID=A0A163C7A7_9NEIS|nr:VanZ family protein [Crenobacter luteus]KZE30282.1 teicoplanin resistance protein VanZ [Crenobacter luteus]